MPTADATNSYCTEAEADDYFASRLYTDTWDDATSGNQNIALIQATRLIDQQMEWTGDPADEGQVLAWPRSGMYTQNGAEIPEDEIPDLLKQATAEVALQLLVGDTTGNSDTAGLRGLKVGPIELDFENGGPPRKVLPDQVLQMLSLWGKSKFASVAQTGGVVKLQRVM